ncbi:uncharacterized protein MYCGRDRAFT_105469 [Zymoseptoria tritici IPO323]|uniref:Methyltransferase small domain-containing protein n=1 Tax=Zymoseptoria tritici (strain CBS 115943 / IPO323) TaxID=336722 RepID=F9XHP1_ZYMTI|nr:uncharacterized protein MYCGRDRAFT_105469 [Zymoseptoria tritici IPO323]EGP85359.1 hypothetical protein MYCGRDRAFT_105469 [Zymoseptoria tritici IPO323]
MPERSGFQYASFDWESYMRFRPAYPPKVYSTVYDHHKANGGSFNSAVDIGAGIGIVSAELVKKFSHVTVTDPSAEYVEAAKAFLAANPKEKGAKISVPYRCPQCHRLPLRSPSLPHRHLDIRAPYPR